MRLPISRSRLLVLTCSVWAGLAFFPAGSRAAALYWDGDGIGVVGGGAGTWNLSSPNWSLSPTGTTFQTWNNATGDDAWLTGVGGAISFGEPVSVRSLIVRATGYALSGATLTFAGGAGTVDVGTASTVTLTVGNVIAGSGGLTKIGAGALTLSAANTFTGGATITAGQVNLGHDLALAGGTITLNGGALAASGAARTVANAVVVTANSSLNGSLALTFTGPVTLTGNRTLSVGNTALTTLAGGLGESGGARGFTKSGNGVLLLTAPSTYTGATTISAGTLALGPSGTISAANLALGGGVLALGTDFTRPLGTGAGQVRFTSSGGFAAYGGPMNITGFVGTPVWGSTANFLPTGRALVLGSSIANNVVTWTNDFSLGSAARTLTANDNSASTSDRAVISGVISSSAGGALTRTGSGRLDLTGANTYTGPTLLQGGVTGVTTLAPVGGGPSSLGAPATVADGTLGLGNTTGSATLLYLGAGSTTDRVLNLAGTTGGGTVQNDGTGALVFTSGVTATGAGTKTLTLAGSQTGANEIQGVIANQSAANLTRVTKTGVGTWELSGANTFSGGVTLSAGTLVAGHSAAFGTGTLTLSGSGATLRGDGTPRALANAVTISNNVIIGGASALDFTGPVNAVGSRTLTVNNTALTTFAGPALVLAENNQARTFAFAGTGEVLVSATVQDGLGTGADVLAKSGAGTLTLTGANTFTGGVTLSAGTLVAGNSAAFGSGALRLSGAGATLRGDGVSRTLANAVTISNSVTIGGASALTFTGAVNAVGSRTLTVNNTALTTFAGPAFVLAENNQTRTFTFSGTGDVLVSSTVQDGTGTGADILAKSGAGTLTLTGANTFTGGVTLSAGTLVAGNSAAFGSGALRLSGAGATLRGDGAPRSLANAVTISNNVTIGGASALTFTGAVNASGSRTLTVNNTALTTFAGPAFVLAESNQTRTFTFAGTGDVLVSAPVQNGPGTGNDILAKTGSGTLTLSGANTFTGGLVVNGGVLRLGANGVLADTLPLTLGNGTLEVAGRNETAGTLAVTGAATIDFGASAAALVYAASNGVTWSGATLTIRNYTAGVDSLRFGTNASALTSGQLAKFRFADYGNASAVINAFGYVSPIPEPAAVAALCGIFGLGLAASRRRRFPGPGGKLRVNALFRG